MSWSWYRWHCKNWHRNRFFPWYKVAGSNTQIKWCCIPYVLCIVLYYVNFFPEYCSVSVSLRASLFAFRHFFRHWRNLHLNFFTSSHSLSFILSLFNQVLWAHPYSVYAIFTVENSIQEQNSVYACWHYEWYRWVRLSVCPSFCALQAVPFGRFRHDSAQGYLGPFRFGMCGIIRQHWI